MCCDALFEECCFLLADQLSGLGFLEAGREFGVPGGGVVVGGRGGGVGGQQGMIDRETRTPDEQEGGESGERGSHEARIAVVFRPPYEARMKLR